MGKLGRKSRVRYTVRDGRKYTVTRIRKGNAIGERMKIEWELSWDDYGSTPTQFRSLAIVRRHSLSQSNVVAASQCSDEQLASKLLLCYALARVLVYPAWS